MQLLARDLIVATQLPQHLSVRNMLAGIVTSVTGDDADSDLIAIDIGGVRIMARVTKAATRELCVGVGIAGVGAGQGGVAARRTLFQPRSQMHDGHDVVVGLAGRRRLDRRIVGRGARLPHDAEAQIMGRQK